MKSLRPFGLPKFETPEGWGVPAKVVRLVVGEGEAKRLVGYKVTRYQEKPFVIPVVDATIGEKERRRVEQMIKAHNGSASKFFKQSYSAMGYSYNMKTN